ncbi:hypothetical protein [Clostridium sp. ATCC 25772]|uniref:hypothetical protein n=1 Tax=Clostridium sp. ATCC 25772 TaxID=1676991 RepID=UPI0007841780|nr:hypothetical protein [Clostridium sp. ATCC 25772]
MKKNKKYLIIIICFTAMIALNGCSLKKDNGAFSFMKDTNVMKITIQSTRDQSYKFTVTDKDVINDIYKILLKAKKVEEKSTLSPDYIFEIYEGPENIHKFNYITGLDKAEGANFYDGNNNYIVSKRLDNDIIKNFWNIRKPLDFEKVYYNSILKGLDQYLNNEGKGLKVAVNLDKDLEMAKFVLSTDLLKFEKNLSKLNNVTLIGDKKEEEFDAVMSLKTEGYTSTKYKGIITFSGKAGSNDQIYYINDVYENGGWNISITKEKPENF